MRRARTPRTIEREMENLTRAAAALLAEAKTMAGHKDFRRMARHVSGDAYDVWREAGDLWRYGRPAPGELP